MKRRARRKIEKIREKRKEEEKVKDGAKERKVRVEKKEEKGEGERVEKGRGEGERVEKERGGGDREGMEKEQEEKEGGEENYPKNGIRICIDWVGEDAAGRGYCKMSEVPLAFGNLAQLLLCLDRLFDSHGYPQAFQERRSFRQQIPLQSCPANLPEKVSEKMPEALPQNLPEGVSVKLPDNLPKKVPDELSEKLSCFLKDDDIWQKHGKYCTVDLVVWSRRRTGWQGCVSLEGGPVYEYRSEMELLRRMQKIIKRS